MQGSEPISVRERTRRTVRAELALLAQDLFAANGYDQTTLDEFVAAAGMSKRTFFRYFTSKEDLVLGKYEILGDELVTALAGRPLDEPVWKALRRSFDIVVDYFADPALCARAVAMEKIIHGNPALSAGELERWTRIRHQLLDPIRERTGWQDAADPRPAAIAGSALTCLIAAKSTWIIAGQTRPLSDLLDEAMGSLTLT